ncbi:MAG: alkaline phosphatase family protein [Candidatus Binatia bacterium]
MINRSLVFRGPFCAALLTAALAFGASPACADGDLSKVNHIIIMMQENRSFDNYLGALPSPRARRTTPRRHPKAAPSPSASPRTINAWTA